MAGVATAVAHSSLHRASAGATVGEERLARSWPLGTTAIDKARSGRSRAAWDTYAAEAAGLEPRTPWAKLAAEKA